MKILIVNDFGNIAINFTKYLSCEVDTIYFSNDSVIKKSDNTIQFSSNNFNDRIKEISRLADKYDLFLPIGWLASSMCYLANVNYLMYFANPLISDKLRVPERYRGFKKRVFLQLTKDTLTNSNEVVVGIGSFQKLLNPYRNDSKVIFPYFDFESFKNSNQKLEKNKKFTFFCPERIESWKGVLILWDIIEKTKSDFIVLKTDWGTGTYYDKAIKSIPNKVKLMKKIDQDKILSYYNSSDALLGQITMENGTGGIEREAISCGLPVFSFVKYNYSNHDPFYDQSPKTEEIAKYIDRIVENEEFRNELKKIQHSWLIDNFDPKKISDAWMEIFEICVQRGVKYKTKSWYKLALKIIGKFLNF